MRSVLVVPSLAQRWVARNAVIVAATMAVFTAVYGLLVARVRPLWFDEVFTAVFARMGSPAAIVEAVRNAADPAPPAFYMLESAVRSLLPAEQIALRLPSSLGLGVAVFSIYLFLRRYTDPLAALAGAGFLFVTHALHYASEARPYGIILGCTAAASVAWQRAAGSKLYPALLGGCLAVAVSMHFYALFVLAAFMASEAWWSARNRCFRPAIWFSFLLAAIPFLLQWPLLQTARAAFSEHFWSKAHPKDLYRIFTALFPEVWLAVPVLGLWTAIWGTGLARRLESSSPGQSDSGASSGDLLCVHQTMVPISVSLLIVLPVAAVTAIWLLRGGIADRYVLSATIGAAFLTGYFISRLPVFCRFLVFLLVFGIVTSKIVVLLPGVLRGATPAWQPKAGKYLVQSNPGQPDADLPLAVSNSESFLQIWYYLPAPVRARAYFLADPVMAANITGTDTVDQGLLRLRKVVSLNVVPYQEFLEAHRRFKVLAPGENLHWNEWLIQQLRRDGCRLTVLETDGKSHLFLSECAPSGPQVTAAPPR